MSRPIVLLFDVDGTLTPARKTASAEMYKLLGTLKKDYTIAVVGGSDLPKQKEQLGEHVIEDFDYSFSENGVIAFREGKQCGSNSVSKFLGEERNVRFINFCLKYFSNLDLPVKRGTFVEYRTGMINISPCGRSVTYEDRLKYVEYEKTHKVREDMVKALQKEFEGWGLQFSIGGQISIDVFPVGWDKTYCLQYLPEDEYSEIHFFGDKTMEGGNDYEIFNHPRTVGHTVTGPHDTLAILRKDFLKE